MQKIFLDNSTLFGILMILSIGHGALLQLIQPFFLAKKNEAFLKTDNLVTIEFLSTSQPIIQPAGEKVSTNSVLKNQKKLNTLDTTVIPTKSADKISTPPKESKKDEMQKKVDSKQIASEDHQLSNQTIKKIENASQKNQDVALQEPPSTPPTITTPEFIDPPNAPNYPTLARKRNQEGTVWIEVWIDESGQQIETKVLLSSGFDLLDKSALNAVMKWRFKPYKKRGANTIARVKIPIEFSLQNR